MSIAPAGGPASLPVPVDDYWPTHLDLPCEDGKPVNNILELPQSMLLTDAVTPILRELHPDGHFCLGQDLGIYWRRLDVPPYAQAVAPDWFYVPDVPPLKGDKPRRSFVMWDEEAAPFVVLEYASGNGSEERDRTPNVGKFWIYERQIRPAYYGIFSYDSGRIEMYKYAGRRFELQSPNERGRYPIPEMGLELGVWTGRFAEMELPWMRWYYPDGTLLPTGSERAAEATRERDEATRERDEAVRLADVRAAKLRELGIDPDTL